MQNCFEAIKQRDEAGLLRHSPVPMHASVQGVHLGDPLVDNPEHFRVSMTMESKPVNLGNVSVCSDRRNERSSSVDACHRCVKRLP